MVEDGRTFLWVTPDFFVRTPRQRVIVAMLGVWSALDVRGRCLSRPFCSSSCSPRCRPHSSIRFPSALCWSSPRPSPRPCSNTTSSAAGALSRCASAGAATTAEYARPTTTRTVTARTHAHLGACRVPSVPCPVPGARSTDLLLHSGPLPPAPPGPFSRALDLTAEHTGRNFDGLDLVDPGLVTVTRWRCEEAGFGEPPRGRRVRCGRPQTLRSSGVRAGAHPPIPDVTLCAGAGRAGPSGRRPRWDPWPESRCRRLSNDHR